MKKEQEERARQDWKIFNEEERYTKEVLGEDFDDMLSTLEEDDTVEEKRLEKLLSDSDESNTDREK